MMLHKIRMYRHGLFLSGMLLPTCRAVTDATRECRYKHTCVRKSCVQRMGVLLLLAVVGLSTYSNACALGPAGVNDDIELWLDASDMKYLFRNSACSTKVSVFGQKVKCWKDRSGNEAHVTIKNPFGSPNYFGQPNYHENVINGKPALWFKRNQKDGLTKSLGSKKWAGDYTLFLVVKQVKWEPPKRSSYFSSGKDNSHMQIGHGNTGSTKRSVWVWVRNNQSNSTKFTGRSRKPRIYAVRDGDSRRITYTNGKLERSEAKENGRNFTEYQINMDRTRQVFNSSYIAEVILYRRNLNDCEFYDVHKYLADKYELRGTPIAADGLTPVDIHLGAGDDITEADDGITGGPDYLIIHDTDDSVGDDSTIHTKSGHDVVYIKGWGGTNPNSPVEVNGANDLDVLIVDDSILSEYPSPCWKYVDDNCAAGNGVCFKSGGSMCYKNFENEAVTGQKKIWSSQVPFDYGGLTKPAEGCEEDVCIGGNIAPVGVPAPVSFSSRSLGSDTLVFQGLFNFDDWSGDLVAYELEDDGSLGDQRWSAADRINTSEGWNPSNTYNWTSYNDDEAATSKGLQFKWSVLEDEWPEPNMTQELDLTYDGSTDLGKKRLDYLRGDHSEEVENGGTFRDRNDSRLGDIFRSRPVYVGVPNLAWPDTEDFGTATTRYSDFSRDNQDRTPIVYVGANDGALHGFDAIEGTEVLRYFPGNLYDSTEKEAGYHFLTDPNYDHLPYVDGTPVVSDVYITSPTGEESWRTVLVGTQGGGGTGLFALDITDPETFNASGTTAEDVVLWEFTQANEDRLGYTYSRPTIALLNDKRWAAITGNGDAPGGLDGSLLILYLEGGIADWSGEGVVEDYRVIPAEESGGLSSPTVIDTDGDGDADRAYAGDTEGNLWVFDLSSSNPGNWKVANGGDPLFENTRDDPQPITVKPTVVRHPTVPYDEASNAPNVMVLFGTGRLNTDDDKSDNNVQTFYGIWDRGDSQLTASDDLVPQEFVFEDENTRITNPSLEVNYESSSPEYGWYIDLPADTGERVVSDAVARGDMIFFNTVIPTEDPCEYGGTGWEMLVLIKNGGSSRSPVLDTNDDGLFNNEDTRKVLLEEDSEKTDVGISGKKMEDDAGLPGGPAIVGDKLFTRGSTESEKPKVTALAPVTGSAPVGRLSWEQLFPSQ